MAANRAPEVETIAAVFLGLTWITSCLRIYVKGFMAKSFALEDWLSILALLLFTATAVFALEGISHSMGLHLAQVPTQNLVPAMQYWFAVELAYVLTTCTLKMSIGIFLLRIANKRSHKAILYFTMSVVMVLTVGYFLFLIFQCTPVDYYWNVFAGEPGSCLPAATVGALTYTHSGVNAAADVVLSLLPVVIVSQLQMNPRTKVTVCAILALGIVACAAVIIRIPYVKILVDDASDFLFASTDVVIWSAIEPGLAITAANMATLRPLFSAFFSRTKLWGATSRNKSSAYGHSKNLSGFSSRRGYMRSGSRGNTDDMGLQDMDKSGFTTIVEAKDFGTQKQAWDDDLENGTDLVIQGNTSNEWPTEIRKTIRLDIVSENGEEDDYASMVAKMASSDIGRRERSRSGSARSHKMGGSIGSSRDLGRPSIQGLPRAHLRQKSVEIMNVEQQRRNAPSVQPLSANPMIRPSLNASQSSLKSSNKSSALPRPTMNRSQTSLGSPITGPSNGSQSNLVGSTQPQGLPRSNLNSSQTSLVRPSSGGTQGNGRRKASLGSGFQIQTQGLPNGSRHGSQSSLASPSRGRHLSGGVAPDSPYSLGNLTRANVAGSPNGKGNGDRVSAGRRISHMYQTSEGGGIRDWNGES